MILLDTHAAVWIALGRDLGRRSKKIAADALNEGDLAISAFSFWELGMLIAKRRLRAIESAEEQRAQLLDSGFRELPLTGDIAILAAGLSGLNGDPADRIIAATAIAHNATLMTADANLLRWRHPLKRQDAEQ